MGLRFITTPLITNEDHMHHIQSPRTDDSAIEQRLANQTAPRVRIEDVHAAIKSETYFTAADGLRGAPGGDTHLLAEYVTHPGGPLSLLTFCVLTLDNGFTVTGESACVSAELFNADLGRQLAKAKAMDKVWQLLGFRLADRLHLQRQVQASYGIQESHQLEA